MKKKTLILSLIIVTLILVGCGGKQKTYETINYSQFSKMIEEKQNFILFIGAESCSACKIYEGTLTDVISDYNVKVYYIDVEGLTDDDYASFNSKYTYSGTPTTIFIENGEEKSTYNRIDGAQSYDNIVEKFKKNGYIKGDN